jgi:hypothetical protein
MVSPVCPSCSDLDSHMLLHTTHLRHMHRQAHTSHTKACMHQSFDNLMTLRTTHCQR